MDDVQAKTDDIMEEVKEFIDSIKAQLKGPDDIVKRIESGDLNDVGDDGQKVVLKHFLTLFWELFLASQELALLGDVSAFVVYIMLSTFCEVSNGKTSNKEIIDYANKLVALFNETIEGEGDIDG